MDTVQRLRGKRSKIVKRIATYQGRLAEIDKKINAAEEEAKRKSEKEKSESEKAAKEKPDTTDG